MIECVVIPNSTVLLLFRKSRLLSNVCLASSLLRLSQHNPSITVTSVLVTRFSVVLLSMNYRARYRVSESFVLFLARNVPLPLMQVYSSILYDRILLDLPLRRSRVASFSEDSFV